VEKLSITSLLLAIACTLSHPLVSSFSVKTLKYFNLSLFNLQVCGTTEVDITRLVTLLFMADREVETKVESCFEIAHEIVKLDQLKAIFDQLFSCYGACYVKKLWDCWAIVKNDGFFYLFDPIGIEVPMKKVTQNRAALYRFDCLKSLLAEFLEIINKFSSNGHIEIGGILTTLKQQEKPKTPKSKEKKKKPVCPEIKRRKTPIMMVPDMPEKCETTICCEPNECKLPEVLFECP
jgi:hypothetical protein